jgi:hypothetical protein
LLQSFNLFTNLSIIDVDHQLVGNALDEIMETVEGTTPETLTIRASYEAMGDEPMNLDRLNAASEHARHASLWICAGLVVISIANLGVAWLAAPGCLTILVGCFLGIKATWLAIFN